MKIAVPKPALHCAILTRGEEACDNTKNTEEYRVAGGIASTVLPICATHVHLLRMQKPHWKLWPQGHVQQ